MTEQPKVNLMCDCQEKMLKIVKTKPEKGLCHAWIELPIHDCALMIKYVNEMSEKALMDMCEGFGNTNYSGIVVQQQLVIAGLEEYTEDEMVEILSLRMEHINHV